MSKSKTTARLIVTYRCNRSCPGCCNEHGNSVREIEDIQELLKYDEIILTGGEPMLLGFKLGQFISTIREEGYKGKIYIYTAFFDEKSILHRNIIKNSDGITYTIHAESNDVDIKALKSLSEMPALQWEDFSSRLIIDSRVYDRYDFSNINFSHWDVIRKLKWKDECKPAEHEELLYFPLDER